MPTPRLPVWGWRKVCGPGPVMRQGPRSGSRNRWPTRSEPFKGGRRAQGSGVGDRREESGVFEGKEGIGKMRKGLANARETGGGEEDIKATVVVRGRGEIEAPSAMPGPRLAGEGIVEGDDKLAGGMDGMGGKVVGGTMETMVGGEREVEGPRSFGGGSRVSSFGLWEQVVPAFGREGDVGGREDGDKMVFGGTNCSFRRVGAMVKGRDVLTDEVDREEERGEVRRGFGVKEKANETKDERESGRKRQQT